MKYKKTYITAFIIAIVFILSWIYDEYIGITFLFGVIIGMIYMDIIYKEDNNPTITQESIKQLNEGSN